MPRTDLGDNVLSGSLIHCHGTKRFISFFFRRVRWSMLVVNTLREQIHCTCLLAAQYRQQF